jgi:hypothetical protein
MLLCGVINELKSRNKDLLSYFFCQATDSRINNATAVLRGLIYLLIEEQPSLVSHVRKKYDQGVKNPFEGINAWVALSTVFENILQDPSFKSTYLIVDALDECETDLPQLLNLVVQSASTSPRVKWIVSSRNQPDIEAWLRPNDAQIRLSLELNSEHVYRAVKVFIDFKVSKLPLIIYDDGTLQETISGQINAKASGTFLWAALVLKELEHVEWYDVLEVLQEIPPGLEPLYDRMMQQVQQRQRKDPELCRLILHLFELGALSGLPGHISNNPIDVLKIVNKCGSFLTIQDDRAYFIHQSAKDFLLEKASGILFPSGTAEVNYTILLKSLEIMSRTLRRDIYGLQTPGFLLEKVKHPEPDPLTIASYSCVFWVDHLLECDTILNNNSDVKDGGLVDKFLCHSYLHWLEALSLLGSLPSGIVMIMKLQNWLKVYFSQYLQMIQRIVTNLC